MVKQIIVRLREPEIHIVQRKIVLEAIRLIGIGEAPYWGWLRKAKSLCKMSYWNNVWIIIFL